MKRSLLVLALATPGCLDLPEPNQFGAHVIVAADADLELCGGTLTHMDTFVSRLSHEFGLDPPTGDDRFLYHWLVDDFHARSLCPKQSHACARGDNSFNPDAPIDHELVHNVGFALGDPRPVFVEGLAVAFEGLADEDEDAPASNIDVRGLLGLQTSVQLIEVHGYSTAGGFVSFLVQRHGLDAFLRMYAAVDRRESERGIDTVFREEFGESLDDSIADFEAMPPCSEASRDAKLLECSAPALAWEGDQLTLHRSIACDQDDAVGPYAGDSVVVLRTFDVPEAGDYVVEVFGDVAENRVNLDPCTICGGPGATIRAAEPPRTLALAAGRHSLRLHGSASARTSLGLRIQRAGSPASGP